MAVVAKQYLDFAGLSAYDALIKAWSNSANQLAYKTVIKSTDGNSIYFYKKPNAVEGTDTPDVTISLGNADMQAQLDALATIVGATYNSTTQTYSIDLDSTFDASTVDIVDALNELKGQINILNGSDSTPGSVAKSIKDAVESLDVTEFPLAEVNSNVVTIHGISETDGVIAVGSSPANDIVLEEVAYTGAAEDVSNTAIPGVTKDVSGTPVSTVNVQDTLEALKNLIDSTEADSALYAIETAGGLGSDTLKSYELVQGGTPTYDSETGKVISVSGGSSVTTINIPKDYLVKDAEVKVVTAEDKEPGGIFENDPNFQVGDKYIDFTVNTVDGTGSGTEKHIYLNVDDLMAALSVEPNAAEVQLAISATNQFSATIVDVAATKITYIPADAEHSIARESVGAALTRIDGDDQTTGSISKKVKDAIDALDTSNDVAIATYDSSNDKVVLVNGISETNGVIGAGAGDGITIGAITTTDIQSLFS